MQIQRTAIEEVTATFKRRIAELERAQGMLQNVLLGAGWIVRNGQVCITYDVADKKARNARVCGVERCMRFGKQDAEMLAAVTKNGDGETAHAVHVTTAVEDELRDMRQALEKLEAGNLNEEKK